VAGVRGDQAGAEDTERFEGHALGMKIQRVADEPSFEWSRDLLVAGAPSPGEEDHRGWLPLPPAQQRDLGVDEASKVSDQQVRLSAADSSVAVATDPD
jgi:hypothetical protein